MRILVESRESNTAFGIEEPKGVYVLVPANVFGANSLCSGMLIVSVSIAVSVHASVSASVSVSALVTVYCYFRHPEALPPPSPQLLQLPFCSIN